MDTDKMNALELADDLDRIVSDVRISFKTLTESATMLRQQQAEIEALMKYKERVARSIPKQEWEK